MRLYRGPKRRRRQEFERIVRLRRAKAGGNDWDTLSSSDRSLVCRLAPRVTYGGRKGWRAFLRLWKSGTRPHRDLFRVSFVLKGFELDDESRDRLMAMVQGPIAEACQPEPR